MRSHSVSAEGGTAAVLFEDEGDTIESHVYDTVKGSDFLADQDVAERLCVEMPQEIHQLDHWGMPWSRRDDGRIDQRNFGGYSFPRATYASDKVGFFEMQTCMIHVKNLKILNILTNGLLHPLFMMENDSWVLLQLN
jgi:succinate dehydrogenase / fumarate reductase flavoprotein subunit